MAHLLLIRIIITMILISIRPYPVKKIFLVIAGLICLSAVSCFAESVYLKVTSTPYDKQMTRIRPVLFTKSPNAIHDVSLAVASTIGLRTCEAFLTDLARNGKRPQKWNLGRWPIAREKQ